MRLACLEARVTAQGVMEVWGKNGACLRAGRSPCGESRRLERLSISVDSKRALSSLPTPSRRKHQRSSPSLSTHHSTQSHCHVTPSRIHTVSIKSSEAQMRLHSPKAERRSCHFPDAIQLDSAGHIDETCGVSLFGCVEHRHSHSEALAARQSRQSRFDEVEQADILGRSALALHQGLQDLCHQLGLKHGIEHAGNGLGVDREQQRQSL